MQMSVQKGIQFYRHTQQDDSHPWLHVFSGSTRKH